MMGAGAGVGAGAGAETGAGDEAEAEEVWRPTNPELLRVGVWTDASAWAEHPLEGPPADRAH